MTRVLKCKTVKKNKNKKTIYFFFVFFRSSIFRNEKKIELMNSELSKLIESLNECKNYYETLQNKEKNLDKNFKKEFPEHSTVVCEQLYKLSK